MISLQDKITKFQKSIYNKELDDFIPIDEQFIGGGITMQSLIKQNAFILQQIKKMKSVFINYCKLNQNVYSKITQHQLELHSQTNKIHSISNNIEHKLNDTIKQVKQMYQQMKYESLRTKNLVNEAVLPIQQAINKKVDESSFTKHMKRIISQLDGQDIDLQDDNSRLDGQGNIIRDNNNLTIQQLNNRKKKGKNVLQQQYQLQKQKTSRLILQLSSKIQQLQIKNQQIDPILYKNTSSINKLILTVDNNQNQIYKLNNNQKQLRIIINQTENKLFNQIINRTNDNIWDIKLNNYQNKSISPKLQFIRKQIINNHKEINKHLALLQPKFINIYQQINQLITKTDLNSSSLSQLKQQLQSISQKLISEITVMQGKLNVVYNQKKVKIQQVHQKIDHQISQRTVDIYNLNTMIKQLTKTIEDKVLIGVKKNLDVKIHQIDKNIHTLTNKQKAIQQQAFVTKGQIHNIKQILSKKANFTDILIHFQKKADKQDFKQLKDKLQTTPSHLKSTIIQSPDNKTRRTISANSRKRSTLSRNLLNPVSALNEDKLSLQSDNDMSSRLFIMGLQNEMPYDRRRMSYTQSTRRKKKMKSTTGILNLFNNNNHV